MKSKPQPNKIRRLATEYMDKQAFLHEQKHRRRKGLARRMLVYSCFVVVFVAFVSYTLINQQATLEEQNQTYVNLENEFNALQVKEVELTEEIELLHDLDYIAEIARRDYYLTFPGETLFQIPRLSTSSD